MANEANIKPGQPTKTAVQSLADLGAIQVNLAVKSIEALTPVAGTLARTGTEILAASVNLLGSALGTMAGLATSAAGTILNAMGAIAIAPVKVIGSVTGVLVSAVQSGIGFAANAVGSILPARKTA